MFRKYLFIVFIFTSLLFTSTDNAQISFERFYGDSGFIDASYCIQQTSDGCYIILGLGGKGFSDSSGGGAGWGDISLLKIDENGDSLWRKKYGGIDFESASKGLKQTSDGGFIITGHTYSFGDGNTSELYIIKTDNEGNLIWEKTYPYIAKGHFIETTADDGYIVGGELLISNRTILLKIDLNGEEQWHMYYNFIIQSGQKTKDGGYVLTGPSIIDDKTHIFFMKADINGETIWSYAYTESPGWAYSVKETIDSGFIAAGTIEGNTILIRTDKSGVELWTRHYPYYTYEICLTNDGGFIFGGGLDWMFSTPFIEKVDSEGNPLWTQFFECEPVKNSDGLGLEVCEDGGYIITGTTDVFSSKGDIFVIKTMGENPTITEQNYFENDNHSLLQNYPNPFNPSTTLKYSIPHSGHVTLKVFDVLGIEVATLVDKEQSQGNYEVEFNSHSGPVNSGTVQNLTSGIYFYSLQTDDYAETKKMILLK